jgi:intracellular sulfur oxidation DsrE/DsrF family protein
MKIIIRQPSTPINHSLLTVNDRNYLTDLPFEYNLFLLLFYISLTTQAVANNLLEHSASSTHAQYIDTPYTDEQKVLFEFYFDEPEKINSALYWLRSYMNTLTAEPYNLAPEFMNIIVLIHGTELVTLAKKNYSKYQTAVQRMRYYQQLGVEFRVCGDAANDYGYLAHDFYDFVKIIPSAIVELAHWQMQDYAIIRPLVLEKKFTIEEIR